MYRIFVLMVFLASFHIPPTSGATIQDIEKMPFDEAYRQWLKEAEALSQKRELGNYTLPWGSTDTQTGKFTPTIFFALTCRLGRDAHVNEAFLMKALSTDDWVSMILDASSVLCGRYGVESEAPVVYDSELGYSTRPRGGLYMGPEARREIWLEAVASSNAQQKSSDPANGSQPKQPD